MSFGKYIKHMLIKVLKKNEGFNILRTINNLINGSSDEIVEVNLLIISNFNFASQKHPKMSFFI